MEPSLLPTPKLFAETKTLQRVLTTIKDGVEGANTNREGPIEIEGAQLLAERGYNWVWLVSCVTKKPFLSNSTRAFPSMKFILREPKDNALLPYQIENEVSFLTYIAKNHSSIPVPRVYAYETRSNTPFIAMEYIEGVSLSEAWMTYTESEKVAIANDLADIIVDLAGITFKGIGGMTLSHTLGPTVEGIKLLRGRHKHYSAAYYDVGPYASNRAYILSCYDKEIYYYSHASVDETNELFEDTTKEAFIASLPEEPFVLNHGDFHGRNIMVRENKIIAMLNWEFAGIYPLSEVLAGTGIDVVEMEDDETIDEAWEWSDRIVALVEGRARARGWDEEKVKLLVGHGNAELQAARLEMLPRKFGEERSEATSDSGLEAVLVDYLEYDSADIVGVERKTA